MDADLVKFSTIYSLQLISENIKGEGGSPFNSYELNLILNDGMRINVVDHTNLFKLRSEAQFLAQKLNIELWDVT